LIVVFALTAFQILKDRVMTSWYLYESLADFSHIKSCFVTGNKTKGFGGNGMYQSERTDTLTIVCSIEN